MATDSTGSQQARQLLLDRQALASLVAGTLLLLISFTTNYADGDLQHFSALPRNVQIGVGLHLAALAALAGDGQLASRAVWQ